MLLQSPLENDSYRVPISGPASPRGRGAVTYRSKRRSPGQGFAGDIETQHTSSNKGVYTMDEEYDVIVLGK